MATVVARGAVDLGALVRDTRVGEAISQTALAQAAGVGRQWLVGFEAGDKPSAPLDMVFRLLRELDLRVTLEPTPVAEPDEDAGANDWIDLDQIVDHAAPRRETS